MGGFMTIIYAMLALWLTGMVGWFLWDWWE